MEKRYRCYRRSSSSLAWRKNRSGIGIRRSRYASFVVLLGLTRVLQSDGDLYPGSFAPLFFHRREISDEIPPERGNSLSGRRASPRWRKASRNAILEDSHTGNIHMYMNFSVRGWYECMRTRKCVHFSFFREKRQFVSLSSKRDSYYRDGRERGKKRICISIKFLIVIFLSSCIFFRIFFNDSFAIENRVISCWIWII